MIALASLVISIGTCVQSRPYRELDAVYNRLEILERRLETRQSWVTEWEKRETPDDQVDEMRVNMLEAEARLDAARGKAVDSRLDLANTYMQEANDLLNAIPNPYPAAFPWWWIMVGVVVAGLLVCFLWWRKEKR